MSTPPAARGRGVGRRRLPYNAHVQHDRLWKYHQRKKVFTKYRRVRKWEEWHHSQAEGGTRTLIDRIVADGPDALEAEYERRLAVSFGGAPGADGSSGAGVSEPDAKGRLPRRPRKDPAYGGKPATSIPPRSKEKIWTAEQTPMAGSTAAAPAKSEEKAVVARGRKKRRIAERIRAAEPAAAVGVKPEQKVVVERTLNAFRLKSEDDRPVGRFSKELKEYQRQQEAKAEEYQRIQADIKERKRKRRETAKGRAVKGQLLAQRTARGQPRMQRVLEAITTKLACVESGCAGSRGRGGSLAA